MKLVVLGALLALAGCRNVLGISGETTLETHTVAGTISGVIGASTDPIVITLAVDGASTHTLSVAADGRFEFPNIPNLSTFTVTASSGCMVTNGEGRVSDADVDMPGVDIICDGALALADFGFSAPLDITPRLTGSVLTYSSVGSFLSRKTLVDPQPLASTTTLRAFYQGAAISTTMRYPMSTGQQVRVEMSLGSTSPVLRTYTSTLDLTQPPRQFGYGKPDLASDGDRFGDVIAVSDSLPASGAFLGVGMPARSGGEVLVFRRRGRSWAQIARVSVPGSSELGSSIGFFGDKLFIGSPGDNSGTGAVHVFRIIGDAVSLMTTLTPTVGQRFGATLVADAMTNSLVVGAPGTATVAGTIHRFNLTSLLLLGTLVPTTSAPGDRFGASIAIGATKLVIGAPGDSHGGVLPDGGAVYVAAGPAFTSLARQIATVPGAGDQFGTAVAVAPTGTYYVGAPFEDSAGADRNDNSAPGAGAVYVFDPAAAAGPEPMLKSPHVDTGDAFGWSLALVGTTLAVGVPFEDSSSRGVGATVDEAATDAGAVYVFDIDNVATPTFVKASNTGAGDQFGTCVALTEDSLIVSAPAEDSTSTGWNGFEDGGDADLDRGAVYSFR